MKESASHWLVGMVMNKTCKFWEASKWTQPLPPFASRWQQLTNLACHLFGEPIHPGPALTNDWKPMSHLGGLTVTKAGLEEAISMNSSPPQKHI